MCVFYFTFGDSLVTSLGRQGLPRIYEFYPGIQDRTPGQTDQSVALYHRRSEINVCTHMGLPSTHNVWQLLELLDI